MGGFLTVEPSGDVMACDKYIDDPDYVFGNLLGEQLPDLLHTGPLPARRAELAAEVAPARACRWFAVCRAACPHDRYLRGHLGIADDASCCGLAPLLADIEAAWSSAGPPEPPDPDHVVSTVRRVRRKRG
jgi:radical SAM protein with 4Fe4S-binding SPASM domain